MFDPTVGPRQPWRVYAHDGWQTSTGQVHLYVSTDSGRAWRASDSWTGQDVVNIVADPNDPRMAYASTDQGVLRTTDGGITWRSWQSGILRSSALNLGALALPGQPQ